MQFSEKSEEEESNSITHSPYYGCTVQVISKARISYEGVLDGISINKDRIFLKNVRVKGNTFDSLSPDDSFEDCNTLNNVMIDHLTNDMHIYDKVCLNVRDIQELKLIRLPATFHESKAKLRAIDPCLVDIRLSPSDENYSLMEQSEQEYPKPAPIARRARTESYDSIGSPVLLSSSSNESTLSLSPISNANESLNAEIEKLKQLSKQPTTLVAKKVLPKRFQRNTTHSVSTQNHVNKSSSTPKNNLNIIKKPTVDDRRKTSPIRVTITSKLNPDAAPFYAQQRLIHDPTQNLTSMMHQGSSSSPNQQNFVPPYHSLSMPSGIHTINSTVLQPQNSQPSYHRFVPPRQMPLWQSRHKSQPNMCPPINSNKQIHAQYPYKTNRQSNYQNTGIINQTSSLSTTAVDQILSAPRVQERLSVPVNTRPHHPTVALRAAGSLPFQYGQSDFSNQFQTPFLLGESLGSVRGPRTVSGTSSGSSLSIEIGPRSIVQLDSKSNTLALDEEQYDFERANEEFRRYLTLEELVVRPAPSTSSLNTSADASLDTQPVQTNSYKKDLSFFDRISCTATTGTAVAYTEVDEAEKNRETFGEDAVLMGSNSNHNEWLV